LTNLPSGVVTHVLIPAVISQGQALAAQTFVPFLFGGGYGMGGNLVRAETQAGFTGSITGGTFDLVCGPALPSGTNFTYTVWTNAYGQSPVQCSSIVLQVIGPISVNNTGSTNVLFANPTVIPPGIFITGTISNSSAAGSFTPNNIKVNLCITNYSPIY
jgi:hypothetical protein